MTLFFVSKIWLFALFIGLFFFALFAHTDSVRRNEDLNPKELKFPKYVSIVFIIGYLVAAYYSQSSWSHLITYTLGALGYLAMGYVYSFNFIRIPKFRSSKLYVSGLVAYMIAAILVMFFMTEGYKARKRLKEMREASFQGQQSE